MGFFDQHDAFLESSRSGTSDAETLNWRHKHVIERHKDEFVGKRIIDIAAHDGRWGFAALRAGGIYSLEIEARAEQMVSGKKNFYAYGYTDKDFEFLAGDVYEILPQVTGTFDVALVLGFLYHTMRYYELMAELCRLGCRTVILETNYLDADGPYLVIKREDAAKPHNAFSETGTVQGRVLSYLPSKQALALLLEGFGFKPEIVEAHDMPQEHMPKPYALGRRIVVVGRR